MAIDYTGMFTGERPNPSAGVAGMPQDLLGQTLQGIQQGEQRSRQALGQMMGKDLRSPADQAREQLSQVDINSVNTPEGLLRLAQLQQATGDTAGAATLASQAQSMRNAKAAAAQEQSRYTAEQALEERKVAATELKAAEATKAKVHKPQIDIDKDGNITVVSTDPTTAGAVLSRGSTKSEAQQIAADVVKKQEEENKIRNLVVKRNVLSGQAEEVRLALKEAQEEAFLPLAANLQLQQGSPLYGSLLSENTYKKLNNAVTSVKSQQALNTIAEMKNQSSTGATGLGATNAMEFIALESAIRALDPLVPSTIEGNLQAIEQNLNNIILINQGKEPTINWDLPVYSHMVYPTSDGGRAYSYDGNTFYKIAESTEQ